MGGYPFVSRAGRVQGLPLISGCLYSPLKFPRETPTVFSSPVSRERMSRRDRRGDVSVDNDPLTVPSPASGRGNPHFNSRKRHISGNLPKVTYTSGMALVILLLYSVASFGQKSALPEGPHPHQTILWSFFIPGGGHFRQGEWGVGATYLTTELGLASWGYSQRNELSPGELNVPYFYALQIHNMGIYTAYRNARRSWRNRGYRLPYDPTPTPQLIGAPFRWKYMSSPWVYGAALAGVGLNYLAAVADKDRRRYRDIVDMRLQGTNRDRRNGTVSYTAYWIPISFGAGVTEEMLFRGIVQTEWEERSSPEKARLGASALFGAAHLDDPTDSATWVNAGFAFLAGLYLGWRTQVNNYRLSEAIAAHTWFDITAGLTIFLTDPDENPLGAKMNFAF